MSVQESLFPSSSESRYLLGLSAFESGDYEGAIEAFLFCLEHHEDPRVQRLAKNYLGETHARLGAHALRQSRYSEALHHYGLAISQAPTYPDYHLGRARAHLGLENLAEHERALRKALELHPRYVDALLALAAHRYQISPEDGLACFEEACRGSDDLYGEPYQWVQSAHREGDTDRVVDIFLSLRSQGAHEANALARASAEAALGGNLAEAEVGYRRALTLAPHYADLHCKLGKVLLERNRVSEAISELREAIGINSRYVEALASLGAALVLEGQENEGADYLVRALEIDPLHPLANEVAARVTIRRSTK